MKVHPRCKNNYSWNERCSSPTIFSCLPERIVTSCITHVKNYRWQPGQFMLFLIIFIVLADMRNGHKVIWGFLTMQCADAQSLMWFQDQVYMHTHIYICAIMIQKWLIGQLEYLHSHVVQGHSLWKPQVFQSPTYLEGNLRGVTFFSFFNILLKLSWFKILW